ncbi:MAG: alpha/beta hydrolase [Nitrospinota bacterium]|jgi:pimeloyl-ACP methyl ester carboxylesterase|nr:alpha/beta hydrolase [Nitrospinota bacterium]
MPTLEHEGVKIHFEEEGRGDPVLLIMGLGCPGRLWRYQVPRLAERFRVITFDNRGGGGSDKPADGYSIEAMADDAARLLSALGVSRAHIAGLSMGGAIAQRLAIDFPDVVRKLVLVGTWAKTQAFGRELLGAWRQIAEHCGMEVLTRLTMTQYLTPDFFDEKVEVVQTLRQDFLAEPQPVYGYIGQNLACEAHSALAELGGIRAETLVVVGRRDGQTPVGAANELASNIPGAKLEILSGVGHGLVWEDPESFNDLLSGFLAGSEKADR